MVQEPRRTLDTYGPEEMAIPEWRAVQKVGADWAREQGAQEGQFYNTLTGDISDELNIIVVDILSGRSRWGAEITSSGPLCFSQDARGDKSADGQDCSKCEFRLDTPWSMDATERRKMCCLNYIILGIDLDHDNMPIIIRTHGVSALPARQLITQLRMNRSLKGEYHRAVVNIKTQEKDTPYGKTYIMRPKLVRLITDEIEAEELKVESQRLLGTPIPLPEARREEEIEPLGFTPKGTPFFSEEDRDRIMAQEAKVEEVTQTPEEKVEPVLTAPTTEVKPEKKVEEKPPAPPAGEPPVEEIEKEKDIPLDF